MSVKHHIIKSLIIILLTNTNCFSSRILETNINNDADKRNVKRQTITKENIKIVISEWKNFKKSISTKLIMNLTQLKETYFQLPIEIQKYNYARKSIKSSNDYYNTYEMESIKQKLVVIYYNPIIKFNKERDQGIHSLSKIDELHIKKLENDIELLRKFNIACRNQISESIIFARFLKYIKTKAGQADANDSSLINKINPSLIRKILIRNRLLCKRFDYRTPKKNT